MKVVEKRIIQALIAGRTETLSCRDRVEGNSVYLHGHCIAAEVSPQSVAINFHGYNTVTTKSRINAILAVLHIRASVFQRNFNLFLQIGEKVYDIDAFSSCFLKVSKDGVAVYDIFDKKEKERLLEVA